MSFVSRTKAKNDVFQTIVLVEYTVELFPRISKTRSKQTHSLNHYTPMASCLFLLKQEHLSKNVIYS